MTYVETPEETQARRQYDAEQTAKKLVGQLSSFVNVMSGTTADAFATALANEHPTLLGQIAKAVGIAVMRRTMRDPEWTSFKSGVESGHDCRDRWRFVNIGASGPSGIEVKHHEHDGRLSCETVVGAELMSRQSFI